MTHICVGKLTIIGSDNGLSPGRRQAIIWTNAAILLIGPLGTNFSEISIKIHILSFKKMHLKMSSGKWRPFCLGLNVLTHLFLVSHKYISELGQHWFRIGTKPLSKPVLSYCQLDPYEQTSVKFKSKYKTFQQSIVMSSVECMRM